MLGLSSMMHRWQCHLLHVVRDIEEDIIIIGGTEIKGHAENEEQRLLITHLG